MITQCDAPLCERDAEARGLCSRHRMRMRRDGTLELVVGAATVRATPRRLLAALAEEGVTNPADIALTIGVPSWTARRWLDRPDTDIGGDRLAEVAAAIGLSFADVADVADHRDEDTQ